MGPPGLCDLQQRNNELKELQRYIQQLLHLAESRCGNVWRDGHLRSRPFGVPHWWLLGVLAGRSWNHAWSDWPWPYRGLVMRKTAPTLSADQSFRRTSNGYYWDAHYRLCVRLRSPVHIVYASQTLGFGTPVGYSTVAGVAGRRSSSVDRSSRQRRTAESDRAGRHSGGPRLGQTKAGRSGRPCPTTCRGSGIATVTFSGAHRGLTPVHRGLTPVHRGLTPVHRGLTPVHGGLTPVHRGLTPVHRGLTPVHRGLTPVHGGLTPVHRGLTPVHRGLTPPARGAKSEAVDGGTADLASSSSGHEIISEEPAMTRTGPSSRTARLVRDVFFIAYVPVTAYLFLWSFRVCVLAGRMVVPLGGDSALFAGPIEASVSATMMTVACVTWSLVYAAEEVVVGWQRLFWQVGMLLLPVVGPPCFYFWIVRHRRPSLQPRRLLGTLAVAVVLSGGLAGGFAAVAGTHHSEARELVCLTGIALLGGFWGLGFWTRRSRGIDDFFGALRAGAGAGAVYGIMVQRLAVASSTGPEAPVWAEALTLMGSAYWGAAGVAFVSCCIVVVPGLATRLGTRCLTTCRGGGQGG